MFPINDDRISAAVESYFGDVKNIVSCLTFTMDLISKKEGAHKTPDECFSLAVEQIQHIPFKTFDKRMLSSDHGNTHRVKAADARDAVQTWIKKDGAKHIALWNELVRQINTGDAQTFKTALNAFYKDMGHDAEKPFVLSTRPVTQNKVKQEATFAP